MRVIFCHHANRKIGNPPTQEDDITSLGIKDAKLTSKIISKAPNLKAIYTSPFYRCEKTANIINKKMKLPIFADDRLNEMNSMGKETFSELHKRVKNFLLEIEKLYPGDETIVCVTSGVNIGGFICWAYNLEPTNNFPTIRIASCSPICFEKMKNL